MSFITFERLPAARSEQIRRPGFVEEEYGRLAKEMDKEYFRRLAASPEVPAGIRFASKTKVAKLVPHIVKLAMRVMANSKEHGTQWWIKNNCKQRIAAYYGSLDLYRAIPDWRHTDLSHPSAEPVILNHGYDENKPMSLFTIEDMQQAAAFRGGKCLSTSMQQGDWDTPLEWQCAEGHRFTASPRLILLGGHWCPECFPFPYANAKPVSGWTHTACRPWHWDAEARRNPFFAQLWAPLHDPHEDNTYGPEIFNGWEK